MQTQVKVGSDTILIRIQLLTFMWIWIQILLLTKLLESCGR